MSEPPIPGTGAPSSSRDSAGSPVSAGRRRRGFRPDAYAIAACFMFVAIVVCGWENFVGLHEELYFLGSRRLADPSLLAADFTWSALSPTTALFDHLLAPLWKIFDAFTIANLGRGVFWLLMAWSVTRLARIMRIPAWAVAAGFTVWLLWDQTLGLCGSPIEGLQPKSFAYPLIFFSLGFAMRGQPLRAGLASGLGTAFHIVVGGWAMLALFLSMLVNRKQFSLRQVAVFLLAAAPFVVPLVASVVLASGTHATTAEHARMDEIYVMFAMPHCCDVFYFLSREVMPLGWARACVVFAIAPLVIFAWPERREAHILGVFVTALIVFFLGGVLARSQRMFGLLELYPGQLANALPALFLFVFVAAWIGMTGTLRGGARIIGALVVAAAIWLIADRGVVPAIWDKPRFFWNDVTVALTVGSDVEEPVHAWIRGHTPRNSVFITPTIPEFWPYAERAQVASMRQPPLDRRLIEWQHRLEALNGDRPFMKRGWDIAGELERNEGRLSVPQLIRIREGYGATHYMIKGSRPDLARQLVHAESGYSIYDVSGLSADDGAR